MFLTMTNRDSVSWLLSLTRDLSLYKKWSKQEEKQNKTKWHTHKTGTFLFCFGLKQTESRVIRIDVSIYLYVSENWQETSPFRFIPYRRSFRLVNRGQDLRTQWITPTTSKGGRWNTRYQVGSPFLFFPHSHKKTIFIVGCFKGRGVFRTCGYPLKGRWTFVSLRLVG